MATTTPNFGWAVPTSSDLVKNGATAIETLGDAIDASLVDLKGGTTGQVLAKASNTDMDFTWATDASGIPATIFDAKGDIIAATAADTASRLAVGANNTVLTADSSTATGLKWGTVSSGALTKIGTYTFTASATLNVNNCFSSTYKRYLLLLKAKAATGADYIYLKLRASGTDSSASYFYSMVESSYAGGAVANVAANNGTAGISMVYADTSYTTGAVLNVFNPFDTVNTNYFKQSDSVGRGAANYSTSQGAGVHLTTNSYDGFSLVSASGTYTGEVVVYGYSD